MKSVTRYLIKRVFKGTNNTKKTLSQTKVCDKIDVQTVVKKVVITPSDKIEKLGHPRQD